jgi:hypothetical protein
MNSCIGLANIPIMEMKQENEISIFENSIFYNQISILFGQIIMVIDDGLTPRGMYPHFI